MNYSEAAQYLFQRHAGGMKLGLENIQSLLKRLQNPQKHFPAIHIAGTNGKGSTAAFTESILRAAGYKTGLYTSPHLVDMRERIRICGIRITEEEVIQYTESIKPHADAVNATFFEILTAMAFCYFRDQRIDIAVLETGLGGRLDATNTADPVVCVITNIDLEHTNILGETLEEIAREKAGILKPGVPAILGSKVPSVKTFFRNYCQKADVPLCIADETVQTTLNTSTLECLEFSLKTPEMDYNKVRLSLPGVHQVENATSSILVAERLNALGWHISTEAIRQGLSSTVWEGRLQTLRTEPLILMDSAHNLMGIQSLAAMLRDILSDRRLVLLFGLLQDKNYHAMANTIAPLADEIILTKPLNERALAPETLAALPCFSNKSVTTISDIGKAFDLALNRTEKQDCLCITGSLYLAGEVLRLWKRIHNLC